MHNPGPCVDVVWGLPRCVWARESTAPAQGNQSLSRELRARALCPGLCSLGLRKGISSSAVRLWPARSLAFLLSLKSCREVPQGLTEDAVGAARAEEGTEIRP